MRATGGAGLRRSPLRRNTPRFDSVCQTCGLIFEADQPLQPGAARVTGPHGHRKVRKRFSPPAVIFKGSGWYITDSRKPDLPHTPAD